MQDSSENNYTARTWFQLKCEHPDTGHLWSRARLLYTFKKTSISALYLFECNTSELRQQKSRTLSQKSSWSRAVHDGIRALFDRIVTRWKPANLAQNLRMSFGLHDSLTPEQLLPVLQRFDNSQFEFDFDVRGAQQLYEQCFIPLLYHELWENIKRDIKPRTYNDLCNANGNINIKITKHVPQFTKAPHQSESSIPTTLIHGSYSFPADPSFTRTFPKLGLCDIVLINIGLQHNRRSFFAIVVHIEDDYRPNMQSNADVSVMNHNDEERIIEVKSNVVLYTSDICSDLVKKHCEQSKSQTIPVHKLTNITSSRRQISAIYNLCKFSKRKSLLRPSETDPYFYHEDIPDVVGPPLGNFNVAQMQVIVYAERIFHKNENVRLHLVHGPPGTGKSKTIAGIVMKLLPQLNKSRKILLCAPSNNACDELSKRILTELGSDYATGTLVRVGREAPLDHYICEHFLESLTMQTLVEEMQNGELGTFERADSIKQNILNNAKVIVSTLNYSANHTLVSIKEQKSIKFIIIDEACQSLEADCLLPFYFGCSKIILVGDPKQLPPCVISATGQNHNLSQSLFTRLDAILHADITLLNIQYRMHEEICQFPSEHFYDGKLTTDESAMNYWPEYPLQPYYVYNLIYTRHTCLPNGGSSNNKDERIFIKQFCIELLQCLVGRRPYVKNDEDFIKMEKRIVVITPYKRQMTKFRESSLQFPRHIEVITVDSAQGKEKDIVLISCVRSGNGTIGFLADEHRLNVMLTRAKRALYIFGNLTWLAEQNSHWDALTDDATNREVIDTVRSAAQQVDLPF